MSAVGSKMSSEGKHDECFLGLKKQSPLSPPHVDGESKGPWGEPESGSVEAELPLEPWQGAWVEVLET